MASSDAKDEARKSDENKQVDVARGEKREGANWPMDFWSSMPKSFEPSRMMRDMVDFMDMAFSRMPSPEWMANITNAPGMDMLVARTDIDESDNHIDISMELPGMGPGDVSITLEGNKLVISGRKQKTDERKDKKFAHVERRYGEFRRVIALPEEPDDDAIEASMDQGLLKVKVRKSGKAIEHQAKPVKIRAE